MELIAKWIFLFYYEGVHPCDVFKCSNCSHIIKVTGDNPPYYEGYSHCPNCRRHMIIEKDRDQAEEEYQRVREYSKNLRKN